MRDAGSRTLSHMPSDRKEPPRAGYDALDDRAQARVRARWDEQIAARIDRLDLAHRLRAAGRPWPEADVDGRVVMRDASH